MSERNSDSDRIEAWNSRICGSTIDPATTAAASQVLRVNVTISRPRNASAAVNRMGCTRIAPRAPTTFRNSG